MPFAKKQNDELYDVVMLSIVERLFLLKMNEQSPR